MNMSLHETNSPSHSLRFHLFAYFNKNSKHVNVTELFWLSFGWHEKEVNSETRKERNEIYKHLPFYVDEISWFFILSPFFSFFIHEASKKHEREKKRIEARCYDKSCYLKSYSVGKFHFRSILVKNSCALLASVDMKKKMLMAFLVTMNRIVWKSKISSRLLILIFLKDKDRRSTSATTPGANLFFDGD